MASVFPTASFIASDGIKICYRYTKNTEYSRSVVLIHSMLYTSEYWVCLMSKLKSYANIYAIDLRGLTGKSGSGTNLSLLRQMQDVLELCNEVGVSKSYIIAHGIGATIGLNFAATYPNKVVRITIAAASALFVNSTDWSFGITPKAKELLDQSLMDQKLIKKLLSELDPIQHLDITHISNKIISNIDRFRKYVPLLASYDIRNVLDKVVAPVLIMTGTDDPFVPVEASLHLQQNLSKSALVQFYSYGHNFPILNKSLFHRLIINFFFVGSDPCCTYVEALDSSGSETKPKSKPKRISKRRVKTSCNEICLREC